MLYETFANVFWNCKKRHETVEATVPSLPLPSTSTSLFEYFQRHRGSAIRIDRFHVTRSSPRAQWGHTGVVKESRDSKGWSLMGGGATVAWVDARLMREWNGKVGGKTGRGMRGKRRRGLDPGTRWRASVFIWYPRGEQPYPRNFAVEAPRFSRIPSASFFELPLEQTKRRDVRVKKLINVL